MNFAEYNTDENFKGNSNADELVKLAFDEGKTRDEVETSLSPLWKEDKKGNVKKALDKYYTTAPKAKAEEPKKEPNVNDAIGLKALQSINAKPEAPKSNPPEKPAEEKVLEKVIEQTETKPIEENKKEEK